jgi:hypothetical protein
MATPKQLPLRPGATIIGVPRPAKILEIIKPKGQ